MDDNSPPAPSATPANAPSAGGGAVAPCTTCSITTLTAATVPSNRARTRIGVGEQIELTFSLGSASWTAAPPDAGTLASNTGATVIYSAPDRAASVTFTATGSGCTATVVITVVEPSNIVMIRRPGTKGKHTKNTASVGFIADIYFMPADVCFDHVSYLEDEVDAVGTGCFQASMASNHVGHHPSTSPITVGAPTSDTSGSRVNGYDIIAANSSSKCDGGWTWSIPWKFQVGSGDAKQFQVVDQVIAITAAGDATISKAGASNSSAYGDATEKDALFR